MSGELQVEAPYFASLFKPVIKDNSVQRYEYVEFKPIQSILSLNTAGRFDFQVVDKTNYWVLSHGRIEHEVALYNETTKAIAAVGEEVALINSGYSIYDKVVLRLETKQVEEVRYHGIVSLVRNLIKYTLDYSDSSATNAMWYLDTSPTAISTSSKTLSIKAVGGAVANLEVDGVAFNAAGKSVSINYLTVDGNKGYSIRKSIQAQGKPFRFLLNLNEMFGFLGDNQVVVTGNQIDLELTPENQIARLIHKAAANASTYKLQFNDISLWLPKAVPSVEQNLKLLKYLESGMETNYQFHQWNGHVQQLPNATSTFRWNVTTTRSKPVAVILCFQAMTKINDPTENGGVFDHATLNKLFVDINGSKYPEREYRPILDAVAPASDKYTRELLSLFQFAMKCDNSTCIDGSVINYENFKSLYPLFVVDVSKRDETIADNATSYRVEIDFGFSRNNGINGEHRAYAIIVTEEMVSFKGVGRVMDVFRLNP